MYRSTPSCADRRVQLADVEEPALRARPAESIGAVEQLPIPGLDLLPGLELDLAGEPAVGEGLGDVGRTGMDLTSVASGRDRRSLRHGRPGSRACRSRAGSIREHCLDQPGADEEPGRHDGRGEDEDHGGRGDGLGVLEQPPGLPIAPMVWNRARTAVVPEDDLAHGRDEDDQRDPSRPGRGRW